MKLISFLFKEENKVIEPIKTDQDVLREYIDSGDHSKAINVIHITPSSDGYEIVKLHANSISRRNGFRLIQLKNGEFNFTGGLVLTNTKKIREFLNKIPKKDQYKFVLSIKETPWVRGYIDDRY